MADLTLEILNNREKYPDDQEITLVDGSKMTVKQLRDQLQPRAEFTRASEGWSREKRQLEGSINGLQGQLSKLQTDLQAAIAERDSRPVPAATRGNGPTEEELEGDPVLGPLVRNIKAVSKKLDDGLTRLGEHEARLKTHEDTWVKRDYMTQLANITAFHNGRYNKDGQGKAFDQKAFLDYAMERGIADLDVAYRSFSRDDEVGLAVKEAEERGAERARKERVPPIPGGRRSATPRSPELPESLDKLTDDQVLNDPLMQRAMAGEDVESEINAL